MADGHCFISYSTADALEFARKLANKLEGGTPSVPIWFDKDDLKAGRDWDIQIDDALKSCRMVLFVMTKDSTHDKSVCRQEWSRALSFKKPIIPLWVENNIDVPFRLADRQRIDFRGEFDRGLAQLRDYLAWLDSPEGILQGYKDRLLDDERDLQRASDIDKPRIEADIKELKKQIEAQEKVAENPEAAKKQTEQNIQNGLERERKPQLPVASFQSSKFINQPPGVAQNYFQDRLMETEQAILFLKNEAQRVLTVVGRGGAGKTAMVCRLLKFVENGGLPDDFERKHGRVEVDGIVYLSEAGSRKVNFANLFDDLCKLLPAASAEKLSALYREPQTSTESKTVQLLAAFQGLKQVIVLLDNFENVVDAEKGQVRDAELDEALRATLHAPHHPVKIIITTRVSARELDAFEPARQRLLPLDTGLPPEYAREAFVLMDEGNLVGIKNAGADLLNLAVTRTLGLPRALEALYAALRTDRFTTLQELLDLPILPEQVVQAYVGEAFNRLDTNAQKVMQALAVYNRPVTPAAVDYLLAPHIPAIDSAPILQRLANMHFARKESGRFYLHPVDREFAFGLIPEKDLTTKYTKVTKENQKDVLGVPPLDLPPLPTSFASSRSLRASRFDAFTQHDLTVRAADYFAAARKPRAEWKKLDDLSAQLAEFDLRCEAGDYDTAASVLSDFDGDYLLLWGHYRLMIDLHEKLQGKIIDKSLARNSVGNLGSAYLRIGETQKTILCYEKALHSAKETKNRSAEETWLGNLGTAYAELGETSKAIEFYKQALVIDREIGDRKGELADLNNLGNRYSDLGDTYKAIEYYEQTLIIAREIGARGGEGSALGNLGNRYHDLGEYQKAITCYEQSIVVRREIGDKNGEAIDLINTAGSLLGTTEYQKARKNYQQAIQIADEMSFPSVQKNGRNGLAEIYLFQNDLVNARAASEAALQFDVPQYNHDASALHGIIALRQGESETAQEAFAKSIAQADEILAKTPEYYSALDAKGLSICGLLICARDDGRQTVDDGQSKMVNGQSSIVLVQQAIETFHAARKIAPHAGVVKSVLRLFDELVKCEGGEILKDVRKTVEGLE
jgi:tetratricopeptide (TPR) repeat protein